MVVIMLLVLLNILIVFNIVYYIPKKLRKLEEIQSIQLEELYRRSNIIDDKIDELKGVL